LIPALPRVAALIAADAVLRIIAFGSSSTEGAGASSPAASYPARLEAELAVALPPVGRVKVLNRGVGGEDAEDMSRRIPGVVAERPDLIIWQTGTNDALKDVALDRFAELTRGGVAAMRRNGSDVLLMEPQFCPVLENIAGSLRYRDAVRGVAALMKVPVVRRYDMMRAWLADGRLTEDQMIAPDGLHMADAGYALLAKEVAREILGGAGYRR
jgi:acyl-CoA thioesterase I